MRRPLLQDDFPIPRPAPYRAHIGGCQPCRVAQPPCRGSTVPPAACRGCRSRVLRALRAPEGIPMPWPGEIPREGRGMWGRGTPAPPPHFCSVWSAVPAPPTTQFGWGLCPMYPPLVPNPFASIHVPVRLPRDSCWEALPKKGGKRV